jgi:hypothetical protein
MRTLILAVAALVLGDRSAARAEAPPVWSGFAGDAQHTADSGVASDSLSTIRWETPVDTSVEGSSGPIYIHYGSPVITGDDTVIVPVKTSASGNFQVEGITAVTGAVEWTYGRPALARR